MDVIYLGHSCFKISNKTSVVVTDPFDSKMMGIKLQKIDKAEIVTISHQHPDHNFVEELPKESFKIAGPGEYEIGGVFVNGIASFHDDNNGAERGQNTIYTITMDGVVFCHLGDLGHKLPDDVLEKIGQVDVLFVPVGGFYTIDANVASVVVVQLDPRIIIPMHFATPKLNQENFGKLEGVEVFLKKMGAEGVAPIPKLVTSKDKLPETTTVVVLE